MIWVTFYTPGYYEQVYKQYLKPSTDKFSIPLRAYIKNNTGGWQENTFYKAQVIKQSLENSKPGELVVWLDVDAELIKTPELLVNFPEDKELGIYYLDWFRHWRNVTGQNKMELVNSVMVLRNTEKVRTLVRSWEYYNQINPKVWEQKNFQDLLERNTSLDVLQLPDEYCCIVNRLGETPSYVKDPVIVQHQASRQVKQNKALLTQ